MKKMKHIHNLIQMIGKGIQKYRNTVYRIAINTLSSSSSLDLNESLIVTKACAQRIQQHKQSNKNDQLGLRISVEGGGCSGFKYVYSMEDLSDVKVDEDKVFERDGSKVVVDQGSFDLIKGATVDYVQEMIRSSFAIVNNPQSESACGCGSSFAVKNFSSNPAVD